MLVVLLARTHRSSRVLMTALVLVLSGALGNLYDNLFRTPPEGRPFGMVRDFVHVYFERWEYHFPTFNVADSCITVGAVLLVLSSFFGSERKSEHDLAAAAGAATDPES
ncbi:MAG: signal peptidase II [Planctomycetota bacterium]